MLDEGMLLCALLCWDEVLRYLTCEFLSCLDVEFVKCFLCIYWEDYVIFTFHYIRAVYHIGWSTCSCISRMNPTRSWCMILSMCCWILFASILLRVLKCPFTKGNDLWLYFLVISLSHFGIKVLYWLCNMSLEMSFFL